MTGSKIVTGTTAGRGCVAGRSFIILIVLVWSGICAADLPNPGFEGSTLSPWTPSPVINTFSPFNWSFQKSWYTEGVQSLGIWYRIGRSVNVGSYQGFYQFVDLTGIGSIKFDVHLTGRNGGEVPFAHFEASLLVDGEVLWRRSADGTYLDQEVDVSDLAGWHRIDIRNTAIEAGPFGIAYWTEWDNLRLVEGVKAIPAVVTLNPTILNPDSNGNWITCYIELTEGQDVRAIDGASVTLNDVPAYMGQQGWATPEANDENVADFDDDGTLERMVRFDRAAVAVTVQPPQGTVTVKGRLTTGGTATAGVLAQNVSKSVVPFEGAATLGVLTRGGSRK
jgi:hypothetical protein